MSTGEWFYVLLGLLAGGLALHAVLSLFAEWLSKHWPCTEPTEMGPLMMRKEPNGMHSCPRCNSSEYGLLKRCVEDGAQRGYRRAHKHDPTPSEDAVVDAIRDAIMLELCKWFQIDEGIDVAEGA